MHATTWRRWWVGLALPLGLAGSVLACGHAPVDYGGVAVMEGALRRAKGAEAALRRSAAAVAIIETDVGRGMGFVIDPSGYLLTNRHVIEDADHIEGVVFPGRDPSRVYGSVRIVYTDPEHDLALLHVHSEEPLMAVPLATDRVDPVSSYLSAADPVVLLQRHAVRAQEPSLELQHGRVSSLGVENPAAGPGSFVGVTADVRQGQSGGPVLDRHGRAVGVVTWTWRDRSGGYAIPIAEATRMLAERPRLEDESSQRARAELRAQAFVDALARGDGEAARGLTSPSEARHRRADTVAAIMERVQDGPGLELMQSFVAALEVVSEETVRRDDLDVAQRGLQELLLGVAQPRMVEVLELGSEIDVAQVVSFFHEVGQAYLRARVVGEVDTATALQSALDHLSTIDASRGFALADLVADLDGRALSIGEVELLPGVYAPAARVEMEAPGDGEAEPLDLHLRLEWGDWYVARLQRRARS